MTPQLRLHRRQIADLASIRDLDPAILQSIISQLRSLDPPPLHPNELRKAIAVALPDPQDERLEALMRQVLSLYSVIGQMGLTVDELLRGLLGGLQNSEPPWKREEIQRWKDLEPHLRELLLLQSVRVVSKTLDISYQYQNLLRTARILTDLRPVFNPEATKIDGAVVSHTLSLKFDNEDGAHSLSLAMDEADIKALSRQCERALLKSATTKSCFEANNQLRVIVSGKEENEDPR